MIFKSEAQLKKYVLDKCEIAVAQAEEKVYEIIQDFVKKYYSEYSPREYLRTSQFYRSLVKTNVKPVGNGFEAEVYFDLSKINYPDPAMTASGWWSDRQATNEEIFKNTLEGEYPHGWWKPAGGTGVWTSAEPIIDANAINYLKKALIANGIPIIK